MTLLSSFATAMRHVTMKEKREAHVMNRALRRKSPDKSDFVVII
jgi:hypothetical protein